jgi:hypothetical protein
MSMSMTIAAVLLAAALQVSGPADVARAASEEFAQARFAPLIARFNAQMKAAATEEALKTVLTQITAKVGPFERLDGDTGCKDAAPMKLCLTPLLFERARVTLQIAIDAEGLIAGLVIAGVAPREGAAPPKGASVRPAVPDLASVEIRLQPV